MFGGMQRVLCMYLLCLPLRHRTSYGLEEEDGLVQRVKEGKVKLTFINSQGACYECRTEDGREEEDHLPIRGVMRAHHLYAHIPSIYLSSDAQKERTLSCALKYNARYIKPAKAAVECPLGKLSSASLIALTSPVQTVR